MPVLRHYQITPFRFNGASKSIVCDEDSYFLELVRYIHLNPLRARLVKDISKLDRYRWSGHSVLMGRIKYEWQDRDYVLSWFGEKEGKAKKAYRQYVMEGIALGRRPELVGGGLVRSLGGWSEVLSMRRDGKRLLTDQRILGSGDFLAEADERLKYQLRGNRITMLRWTNPI